MIETLRVYVQVPRGWRRVRDAEVRHLPELATRAKEVRDAPGFTSTPYGALAEFQASDGQRYATFVEQHYHPPGGPVKPWGFHHGVTLLTRTDTTDVV